MSNRNYDADLAVIKSYSYTELLCVFRYAPLGIALFSDTVLNSAFSNEMKIKGDSLTVYEKSSISKMVSENANHVPMLLSRFSEYAKTSPPQIKLPPIKTDKKIKQPKTYKQMNKEQMRAEKLAQKTAGKITPITEQVAQESTVPAKAKIQKKASDEQDWARLFELSQVIATAKEEQDKLKEKLMARAVELGLFNEGSKTATFPNGLGKIRMSFSYKLVQPKEIDDEFFEQHGELFILAPDEKRIINILQSDDEDAIEALNAVGFAVKTSESRTFTKS